MKFQFSIIDLDHDVIITLQNLDLDALHKLSSQDAITDILSSKFYLYSTYDKTDLLGYTFMILKSTKKNVVMINV